MVLGDGAGDGGVVWGVSLWGYFCQERGATRVEIQTADGAC